MNREQAAPISLDQALAGMVLSEAILDDKREVLLPNGAVLTDAAIASLRRRGIGKLNIVAMENNEAREAARQLALQRLQRLFRNSGGEEPAQSLFDCLSRYRME